MKFYEFLSLMGRIGERSVGGDGGAAWRSVAHIGGVVAVVSVRYVAFTGRKPHFYARGNLRHVSRNDP